MMSYHLSTFVEKNPENAVSADVVKHLQSVAKAVLDPLIPEGADVVMLDYPNNTNVGDSLIWLGEMAYLKQRKANIQYVCDVKNYDQQQLATVLKKDTLILMHGGGNFGTVWSEIHSFRMQVLNDFSHHTIIQLPQTLRFEDEQSLSEIAAIIKTQRNFHLLVRSAASATLAKHYFNCKIHLCPDMAFYLGHVASPFIYTVDVVAISRTDHEKSNNNQLDKLGLPDHSVISTDWLQASRYERFLHRIEMHTKRLRSIFDRNNLLLFRLWNMLSAVRMRRGVNLLAQGNVVITDRLHVHILSTLMGKSHLLIDNSYGKLSNFYNTWTYTNPDAHWMHGDEDIPAKIKQLLNPSRRIE